jgi:hypothetical protein
VGPTRKCGSAPRCTTGWPRATVPCDTPRCPSPSPAPTRPPSSALDSHTTGQWIGRCGCSRCVCAGGASPGRQGVAPSSSLRQFCQPRCASCLKRGAWCAGVARTPRCRPATTAWPHHASPQTASSPAHAPGWPGQEPRRVRGGHTDAADGRVPQACGTSAGAAIQQTLLPIPD